MLNMFNLKKKLHKQEGFTLIEMLIAVLIFTISLTSLTSIASRGLKTANQARKQVVADYLAIEAIEVVRNMRDGAFLKNLGGPTWDLVLEGGEGVFDDEGCFDDGTSGTTNSCNFYFDSGQPILAGCTDCNVYVNEPNFYYFQTEADATPGFPSEDSGYTREIKIKEVSEGQIFVFVRVSWDGGTVSYTENLFLWQ